jgi:predicted metal-dependent peptidase
MKRARRFPNRPDIKGVKKDRVFDLVVGVDVSWSMSTHEIMQGLNEIHAICKLTGTSMKLIQIDTKIHNVQDFSEKTVIFERTAAGGTYMGDIIPYIIDNRISCDALIMISDMCIEDVPNDANWQSFKKKVLWLSTDIIPTWDGWNKHKIFPLKLND